MSKKKADPKNQLISHGTVAQNRKARHNYTIEDTIEAGIALMGTEVKSLRHGRANIAEAFAQAQGGELYLVNAYIADYAPARHFRHEERRKRKLLLHRRELNRLIAAVGKQGATIVPLSLYFNNRGYAKVQLGLAKGKNVVDKRQTVKKRDWERQKARIMRDKG
ncbi:tmRNA-binding protein SmpB [Caenispirillum salinarum AK4]|uniref:SsrA-binding protein n=1 Tax=Caenispirillum salinarum AK4 TaxID=1238182 RepID=K9H1G4_9PROT|nr:SsrA-binding protein SmpB [Caenispirillum salinarum]EKV31407.1 tmRNA-binding protein SmpB [Caenispirillum salinarum AK4]